MPSAKWQPFGLGLDVLTHIIDYNLHYKLNQVNATDINDN